MYQQTQFKMIRKGVVLLTIIIRKFHEIEACLKKLSY